MTFKEWPECYQQCYVCEETRHRDDMVEVKEDAIDPYENRMCINCASKKLSALVTLMKKDQAFRNEICGTCGKTRFAHHMREEGSDACFSFREGGAA